MIDDAKTTFPPVAVVSGGSSGVDVERTFQTAALDASIGRGADA